MKLLSKQDKIILIKRRDGHNCFLCKEPFVGEQPTIDHWIPRSAGGSDDVSNLRLSHKKCNILKGDIIPNEDGTITYPPRRVPYARRKKQREDILSKFCDDCENGRMLGEGQICNSCGSNPGPSHSPRYLKRKSPECDHNMYWCWACSIGITERKSVISNLMTG